MMGNKNTPLGLQLLLKAIGRGPREVLPDDPMDLLSATESLQVRLWAQHRRLEKLLVELESTRAELDSVRADLDTLDNKPGES
ncbi:MAG: hypothetical protein EBR73_13540 [Rhodobacteraceae bacterium]|jgi:hypothetical protein|nr:hypothetical protein [Paracoccaceae bacterium]